MSLQIALCLGIGASQSLEEEGERLYLGIEAVCQLYEFAKSSRARYRDFLSI